MMTPLPPLRYFDTHDGTTLAYRIHGADEGPTVVLVNGLGCIELYWQDFLPALCPLCRVVVPHTRGHEASALPSDRERASVGDLARDVLALMDLLGVEKTALVGFSLGVQVILEAYRQAPHRVSALSALLGPYENPFATFLAHPALSWLSEASLKPLKLAPSLLGMAKKAFLKPGLAIPIAKALGFIAPSCPDASMAQFLDHFRDLDPTFLVNLSLKAASHSAKDVLAQVMVPTLVISGGQDLFTPNWVGRRMALAVNGAEIKEIPGLSHAGLLEDGRGLGEVVRAFLIRRGILEEGTSRSV